MIRDGLGKLLLSLPKASFLFAFFSPLFFFLIFVFHVLLFLIDFFCGRNTNMKCVHGYFHLQNLFCCDATCMLSFQLSVLSCVT